MELVCTTLQVVFPFSVNPIYHVLVSALRPCHRCLSRPVSRLSCGCPQRHIGFPFRFAHGLPSAGTRNDLERHRAHFFIAPRRMVNPNTSNKNTHYISCKTHRNPYNNIQQDSPHLSTMCPKGRRFIFRRSFHGRCQRA